MLGSRAVAVELGRKRLCALQASFRRDGAVARRMHVEPIPADLSRSDPEALGAWLKETLSKAGMATTRAVVALSRDEVILKRLSLPTTEDAELPDMTRLAVSRELPFDPAQAVIDFVPLEKSETSTTVLAVAMPRGELEAAQQVFETAGIEVDRISLRVMGAAVLLASVPGLNRDSTLLIDITGERIEFSVVRDGAIRFSRAADLPADAAEDEITDAIVTETRRTWLSYRIGDDTDGVRHVIMLGDEIAGELAMDAVGEVLSIQPIVLHSHPEVDRRSNRLGVTWPLAGLLVEDRHKSQVIDMAHPRQPPDVHAKMRLRILAAAAVFIALVGVGFTLLRADLNRLRNREAQLAEELEPMVPMHWRYQRDFYKLQHIDSWQSVHVNWLDHLEHIVKLVPGRGDVVLNDLTGGLTFNGVRFESPETGKPKQWLARSAVQIGVLGEAKDRVLADQFREAIVNESRYSVTPSGVEREGGQKLDFPFNYKLYVLGRDGAPDNGAVADESAGAEATP